MTTAPIRRRPRPELWLAPAARPGPARRPPSPVALPLPPPPLEVQEAAIFAELACWGREALI